MSDSASCSDVMSAVDKELQNIIAVHSLRISCLHAVQDELLNYFLTLKDEDLIEVLSKRKTIYKHKKTLPMMDYAFTNCKSQKVCKWITENTKIEDEGILYEYLNLKEKDDWKVKLIVSWFIINNMKCNSNSE